MKNVVVFLRCSCRKENLLLGCGFLILVSILPLVASASRYRTISESWITDRIFPCGENIQSDKIERFSKKENMEF